MDKHGRLIDADALEREGWSLSRNRQVDYKTMVYEVKKPTEFPTIEPERKTGKWVKPLLVTNTDRVRCSECSAMYDWYTQAQYFNFCPNCGVDMRGEEHDRQM